MHALFGQEEPFQVRITLDYDPVCAFRIPVWVWINYVVHMKFFLGEKFIKKLEYYSGVN